jgi:hypothetical protein
MLQTEMFQPLTNIGPGKPLPFSLQGLMARISIASTADADTDSIFANRGQGRGRVAVKYDRSFDKLSERLVDPPPAGRRAPRWGQTFASALSRLTSSSSGTAWTAIR